MKRIFTILALSFVCALCAIGFSACGDSDKTADMRNPEIVGVYNTYVAYAEENGTTPLSYDEWLAQIKGEKGDKGEDGKDGVDGLDGKDGKNGTDGIDGINGNDGVGIKSAIINENGNLILTMTDNNVINAGKVKDVHPHEIIEKEVIEREPTCTRVGLKYVYCDTCGEILKTVIVEKTQHDYEDIITPPTCTEQGYTTHTCKDCGHVEMDTYTEIIPHTYIDTITKPTCTEQGYTTHTCEYCGYNYKDNYTTADTTEHNYIEKGEIYGDCALSMKQDYICTRCQHEKTETITAQAPDVHNHLNIGDTCEHCGWSVYTKNGDSLLMKNSDDKLSAEFYGTTIYTFDNALKQYIINTYISDSVTSIGSSAFNNCSSLTSVTIPDSVTSIGDGAFYDCSRLTSITIPDSITSIGNSVFNGCTSLISFTIPDCVTSIGYNAFAGCRSLTSIIIPDSVTSIGSGAFDGCSSLSEITIPDSVTSIGNGAFDGCTQIQETEQGLIYVGNILVGVTATSGLPQTQFIVRAGTRCIADNSFYLCSLTNVTIPDSVTRIGNYAFCMCSNLSSIDIPDNVISIGEKAFSECSNLSSVTIGNSVIKIDQRAFQECKALNIVYYKGNDNDWKNISINNTGYGSDSNDPLKNAMRYYYSETAPTESGNYWHYDTDGVTPVIWVKKN